MWSGGGVFPAPVPACPQYIQTNGLHDGGKPHCFHAANTEMLDTGAPVEFRHGRLDTGPVPILVPEHQAAFLPPSTGQSDIFVGVPKITGLFPLGDGTLVKRGALNAGSHREGRAVARSGSFPCGQTRILP